MKVSEVKKHLFESLSIFCEENNFKINKGNFKFSSKAKNVEFGITFLENHWFDEIQLMPKVFVDIIEINQIIRKFNPNFWHTYNMNLKQLEYWMERKFWDEFEPDDKEKFKIFNYEEDIITTSKRIIELYNSYGIKYIQNYSTPEGVDILMNSDLLNPVQSHENYNCAWWHTAGFHTQSFVGLVAAKLSRTDSDYLDIAQIYFDKIMQHKKNETMYEDTIEEFLQLYNYLK